MSKTVKIISTQGIIAILVLFGVYMYPSSANAQSTLPKEPAAVADRLVVQFHRGTGAKAAELHLASRSQEFTDRLSQIDVQVLHVPEEKIPDTTKRLQNNPNVKEVSRDYTIQITSLPESSHFCQRRRNGDCGR